VLDLGREIDPKTGKSKRKQKWITFRGTRKEAESKLNELLGAVEGNTFVEPTKVTLIEYLRVWLDKAVKPPMRRPETHRVYQSIIEKHIAKATIGSMLLRKLRASDLERYYAELKAKPATVKVHHAILHRALKKAVKERLIGFNPAADLDRPKLARTASTAAKANCWTVQQARAFLKAATEAGTQTSAFFHLALDTGARKSELYGLAWSHIDLDKALLTIERQLDSSGTAPTFEPVFGPTKTKQTRTVSLAPETVVRLRAHKRAQAALKMANRMSYQDCGLVFAKEPEHLQSPTAKLGQPLTTFAGSLFATLIKAADVPGIKFHGLRHTSATLLIAAGVPMPVVAERLGHAQVSMTADVYAHVLPDQQASAAATLGALLHG
jgi:integrase